MEYAIWDKNTHVKISAPLSVLYLIILNKYAIWTQQLCKLNAIEDSFPKTLQLRPGYFYFQGMPSKEERLLWMHFGTGLVLCTPLPLSVNDCRLYLHLAAHLQARLSQSQPRPSLPMPQPPKTRTGQQLASYSALPCLCLGFAPMSLGSFGLFDSLTGNMCEYD